jgi:isopenicillin N synthase-like dioxygenase
LAMRLEDDDVVIQGGQALQILTNNRIKAQAHRVVAPTDPKIGRMSVVHFIYPPLDLIIEPLGRNKEDKKQDVLSFD